MNIESRTLRGTVVFEIIGDYTRDTCPSPSLRELVQTRLEEGERRFLLNLEKAEIVGNFGVGEILASYIAIRNAAGQLRVVLGSQKTHAIFRITMLDKVLEVYDNVESALENWDR